MLYQLSYPREMAQVSRFRPCQRCPERLCVRPPCPTWPKTAAHVVFAGDNTAMPCPTCTRLDRDEALLRDAVDERVEVLRFELPEDVREAVLKEERLLATLLARIEERRAAGVP